MRVEGFGAMEKRFLVMMIKYTAYDVSGERHQKEITEDSKRK